MPMPVKRALSKMRLMEVAVAAESSLSRRDQPFKLYELSCSAFFLIFIKNA